VFPGTALLLAAVVGSGIMGERLATGNVAIALLANTIATGAALQTPPCDPPGQFFFFFSLLLGLMTRRLLVT
jgi:hypothetical protein